MIVWRGTRSMDPMLLLERNGYALQFVSPFGLVKSVRTQMITG